MLGETARVMKPMQLDLYPDALIPLRSQAWTAWAIGLIYSIGVFAFLADVTHAQNWPYGVFYIPVVCTGLVLRDARATWRLAALTCVMIVVGCLLPKFPNSLADVIASRSLSLVGVLVSAVLVHHAHRMQERLAEQTVRAQAADRMKTQILTNLSHELRTPLNAVIGFSELLAADCRPDQRDAVEHVHGAGRRLLATIENLIDLVRLPDRALRHDRVDLGALTRQAINAARAIAVEQHVTLVSRIDEDAPRPASDAWALRRILDNLIGNAVKFSSHDSTVEITLNGQPDMAVLTISDRGTGMPAEVLRQIGQPFFQADTGATRRFEGMGMGLALSLRLAEAIGARLHFESLLGQGTTVTLRVPLEASPGRAARRPRL